MYWDCDGLFGLCICSFRRSGSHVIALVYEYSWKKWLKLMHRL